MADQADVDAHGSHCSALPRIPAPEHAAPANVADPFEKQRSRRQLEVPICAMAPVKAPLHANSSLEEPRRNGGAVHFGEDAPRRLLRLWIARAINFAAVFRPDEQSESVGATGAIRSDALERRARPDSSKRCRS